MATKKAPAPKNKNIAKDVIEESYDDFPYESYVYPQTHPERMSAIASLFRLSPPDINKARILEIGCASGGNLIPLSVLYPKTKSLGVDLSKEQVTLAEAARKAMGLKNIEFRQIDISKFGKGEGQFDYIICHGVFSWVPGKVRDSIFEVCKNHLAPKGLAVISFNTLPGWSAVKSLREMMMFHTKSFKDPAQQIHESKMLLNFLYENTPAANETYRQIIDRERQILLKTNDSYLFHEHLEAENHQFYLHEFVTMAGKHKLAYVGDAELSTMYLGNFNDKVRKTLGEIKDVVRQEQYIDFLTNRRFRHSILTRAENLPSINRNIDPERILDFYVQARFRPEAENAPGGNVKFTVPDTKASFHTNDLQAARVFKSLAEKNRPVKINDLAAELQKTQKIDPKVTKTTLGKNGLPLVLQNFLSLHTHSYEFSTEVSKKPKAFPWARYLAQQPKSPSVTNMKRETVNLPPFMKTMLSHLDGKTTHDALLTKMTTCVVKGELKVHKDGKPITNEKEIRSILEQQIEPALKNLAAMALLES